jgi:hypothetical protein
MGRGSDGIRHGLTDIAAIGRNPGKASQVA